MRIALFGTQSIHSYPELQDISRRHTVIPYMDNSGEVRDWQNDLRRSQYDILHFAGHVVEDEQGRPSRLVLGEKGLSLDDVVNMGKLAGARLMFFNSCETALFANFSVRNGLPASIYTTSPLLDDEAWKYPLMFYEQVARQEDERAIVDLRKAFEASVDRSGFYGWVSNGLYERDLLSPIVIEMGRLHDKFADHQNAAQGHNYYYQAQLDQYAKRLTQTAVGLGGGLAANLLLTAASLLRGWF